MSPSGMKGWQAWIRSENILHDASLFSKGTACWPRRRVGQSSFRGLDEGRRLNASLVNKRFVPIDEWGQEAQLIIYEAKRGNLEGLCLACR